MKTTLNFVALLGLTLAACAKSTPPTLSVGGETNWLVRCSDDAACGQGACLCGVCARECSAERACDGAFAGTCVATSSGAGEKLCAAEKSAVPARVCLPDCTADKDCGTGFDCEHAVCVPHAAEPDGSVPDARITEPPIDSGPDSTVPEATSGGPDTGTGKIAVSDPRLAMSLTAWNGFVAEMGDTYSYAEENCLVNAPEHTVTTIQVTDGVASLFASTTIATSQCLASVNRYDSFTPRTVPALYAECDDLVGRQGNAVTIEFDDRGLIRGCTWPGDSNCQDNCGEGFYLRALMFGTLEVP
jgi:hypothetical protein